MIHETTMVYAKEELDQKLIAMRAIADNFHFNATRIGNPAFIQFCGLMSAYVDMCRDAYVDGVDFTTVETLPLPDHTERYINEKLLCIFGRELKPIERDSPEV